MLRIRFYLRHAQAREIAKLYANTEARQFFGTALEFLAEQEPSSENTHGLDIAVDYFYVSWAWGATEADLQQLRELTQRARALANGADGTKADHVRVMRLAGELGNALFAK